jgi:hypothetical protein
MNGVPMVDGFESRFYLRIGLSCKADARMLQ